MSFIRNKILRQDKYLSQTAYFVFGAANLLVVLVVYLARYEIRDILRYYDLIEFAKDSLAFVFIAWLFLYMSFTCRRLKFSILGEKWKFYLVLIFCTLPLSGIIGVIFYSLGLLDGDHIKTFQWVCCAIVVASVFALPDPQEKI